MVRQITSRSILFNFLGKFLLSAGIILGCLLSMRLTRKWIDGQIEQKSQYLVSANTLAFELPPATPLPTFTPTPTPTATPPPPPAIRISIPSIDVNSSIVNVSPIGKVSPDGELSLIWDAAAYVVGHFETSGNPGGGRNIVLAGHNNTLGEVFRDLDQLNLGDEVILFTDEQSYSYTIQKKYIIPFMANQEEGNLQLQSYSAPQNSEMVTLISCWPYATNASRIILIAVPSHEGDNIVQ